MASKWHPWFWGMVVLNPAHSLDLVDEDGNTDHAKIVPFMVLVVVVIAHFMGKPFTVWDQVVMFSASFGYAMWRTFLKSGMLRRADTVATSVVHTITERRDPVLGIDPA